MPNKDKTHEGCFQFKRDFDTKNLIGYHAGRLYLAGGHCVRMVFGPKGLILVIPQEAIDDGSISVGTENSIKFPRLPSTIL